jgi:archaellum biogenesis protein FlaJ (TadC family)
MMLAYVCLLACVAFVALTCVLCGIAAGWLADSTLIASLTSLLLFAALLAGGCWLLYQTIPPDKDVHAQSVGMIILLGGSSLVIGGSFCALVPVGLRWLMKLESRS